MKRTTKVTSNQIYEMYFLHLSWLILLLQKAFNSGKSFKGDASLFIRKTFLKEEDQKIDVNTNK